MPNVPSTLIVRESGFGVVNQEQSDIEVRNFETAHATVEVCLHRKINLGDYNSLMIEVGVKIPCYVEEVQKTMSKALSFCENRLNKQIGKMEDA
jgi:hypothetical protein